MALNDGVTDLSGLRVAGVPTIGAGFPLYTGKAYFVNEDRGSDSNPGSADQPLASLFAAHALCRDGYNDVVYFTGTQHIGVGTNSTTGQAYAATSTLVWSKSQTHLIGCNDPLQRGKRARVSVAGTTAFDKLVSVTGSGCEFRNFGTFYGFNSVSALICWSDTGGRNAYNLVEFMGFGDATVSTGTAVQTGARALLLSGSTGECTFRSCVFGVDTLARNATNYTVEIAAGSPRNYFFDCDFECLLGSSGTGAAHLLVGSGGIDRYLKFVNCRFGNSTKSGGSTMAQAFNINASAGGWIHCISTWFSPGITNVETTASTTVAMAMGAPAATDSGLMLANAP